MAGSSIVKSGELSLFVKGFMKSSWVKKFCVLYMKTEEHHPYLEFFDDKDAFIKHKQNRGKTDVRRVELQNVKYIRSSTQKSGKASEYQIEMKCRNQKHLLMFSCESDSGDWYTKLNASVDISERGDDGSSASHNELNDQEDSDEDEDTDDVTTINQMYASTDQAERFTVDIEKTPLATICNIVGKMTLIVTKQDIAFEHPETKQRPYSFQLSWMRRFGKKQTSQFYFEVGRKCPNGEGTVRCITESAKIIHQRITEASSSRSKLVIPHKTSQETTLQTPSPDIAKKAPALSVTAIATNMTRRHPGTTHTPSLIPIEAHKCESDDDHSSSSSLRKSGGKNQVTRQASVESANEILRTSNNGKFHAPISNIAKALEEKLHSPDESSRSNSIKTKEEKKKEKEEKKEREKREKEDKKEKERKEKEEKKEKEKREKEERKKSKKKTHESPAPIPSSHSVRGKHSTYEEVEPHIEFSHGTGGSDEILYDEAVIPSPNTASDIVEYSEPCQVNRMPKPDVLLYEDTTPVGSHSIRNQASEPVEYTQPYTRKGGVKISEEGSEPMAYMDVKIVKDNAWKKYGRTEEDEVFEENYDSIKSARDQILAIPPIPDRGYNDNESTEYDDDDTYNRLDLNMNKHAPPVPKVKPKPTENLYGTASAKKVGQIDSTLAVRMGDDDTESEGEEMEEFNNTYSTPAYESPMDVMNGTSKSPPDAYEQATPMQKPAAAAPEPKFSTRPPRQNLYEDVS